jgi:hypothetical protein
LRRHDAAGDPQFDHWRPSIALNSLARWTPSPNDLGKFQQTGSAQIHPVILSGGAGTRLWPLSRTAFPKQLLPLVSERTLLQETAARNLSDVGFASRC